MSTNPAIEIVDPLDYLPQILNGVHKGALITTKSNKKINSMTISWGQIGYQWEILLFTIYVRTGRFTHKLLEESKEFTLNIGMGGNISKILKFCGTKSGRDFDKIKELGLTTINGINIETPGIQELPLTLECEVIYQQLQDKEAIAQKYKDIFYPENISSDKSDNSDYHTLFHGKVVGAYLIK